MKRTIFTLEEKEVITQNLEQRLVYYRKDGGLPRNEKIIEDIFRKMIDDWDEYYRDRHKVEITSVINESLTKKKDRLDEFLHCSSSRFTKLTGEDKKDLVFLTHASQFYKKLVEENSILDSLIFLQRLKG